MTLAGSDAEKAAGLLKEREDGSGSVSNADCDVDCRKAISEVFTLLQALEAEQNLLYKDWEDTRTTAPHLVSASNQVACSRGSGGCLARDEQNLGPLRVSPLRMTMTGIMLRSA